MEKKIVKLIFPQKLITEPVTFRMAKKFNIIPNIRRAKVTDKIGELVLELEGEESNLKQGLDYLNNLDVKIEPITGDIVE